MIDIGKGLFIEIYCYLKFNVVVKVVFGGWRKELENFRVSVIRNIS